MLLSDCLIIEFLNCSCMPGKSLVSHPLQISTSYTALNFVMLNSFLTDFKKYIPLAIAYIKIADHEKLNK